MLPTKFTDIYNDYTLNIFSDASMDNINDICCYGSIAACRDTILDQSFFVRRNTHINHAELLGIIHSLNYAYQYQNNFKVINIFSDSLINLNNLRNIDLFKLREYDNGIVLDYELCLRNKKPAANQQSLKDAIYLINELSNNPNIAVNYIYQPGHLFKDDGKLTKDLQDGFKKFINNNIIADQEIGVDKSMLLYISRYNDYVDRFTRSAIIDMTLRTKMEQKFVTTPVHFNPYLH